MEQEVETSYRTVCSTCLSSDRDLFSLNSTPSILQIFRLLMYDFAGDRLDILPLVCWECLANLKRVWKFKWQVHNAQKHLRVLSLNDSQEVDHSYLSQTLSSLVVKTKLDYDKIFDYTNTDSHFLAKESEMPKDKQCDVQAVNASDDIKLEIEEIESENTSADMLSHMVVDSNTPVFTHQVKREGGLPRLTIQPLTSTNVENVISQTPLDEVQYKEENTPKPGYITEYMTEAEMLASREQMKNNVQYTSSVYKCELCIIGFSAHRQVEIHFVTAHRQKPGLKSCKVCYTYTEESKLRNHLDQHHMRYLCKLCGHREFSVRLIQLHVNTHKAKPLPRALNNIEGTNKRVRERKKSNQTQESSPKPGDFRKKVKTTEEGYKCLNCDKIFKNWGLRKTHFNKFHREWLQCDHCKKKFVNRNTLITHLRLHEGPLPREECPICHKMVRVIQLKYHIRRHQNRDKYECSDCQKIFSHLVTYQAHLKYSRAHATEQVFKYKCSTCDKKFGSETELRDHINYQHKGQTVHTCPVCGKGLATKRCIRRHVRRAHEGVKESERDKICQRCGKAFRDNKSLREHEYIHTGERPLTCELCGDTFRQRAALYTHRKRVHKLIVPQKTVTVLNKD